MAVTLRVGPRGRCSGTHSIYLSFPYDEYIIKQLRTLPTRYWYGDRKEWEVPISKLSTLLEMLKEYEIHVLFKKDFLNVTQRKAQGIPKDFKWKTEPYQHQIDGVEYGLRSGSYILGDEQGLGKALSLDTRVCTPTGFVPIKDIEVGDTVYGCDGLPTKVLNVYNFNDVEMYKITFSDGVSVKCCKDHLWKIIVQGNEKVVDTSWLVGKDQFGQDRSKEIHLKRYHIPLCKPIQFPRKEVPMDPYLLGVLLGDGGISRQSATITSEDPEIFEGVSKVLPEGCILRRCPSQKLNTRVIQKERHLKRNPINTILKDLDLSGHHSYDKFIPDIYKYNTPEVRLGVLQGLLDTDGYAMKGNTISYTTTSKQLIEDTLFIVQSLGGMGIIHQGMGKYNGIVTRPYYTLRIKFSDNSNLCRLTRKKVLLKPRKFVPRRLIVSIERIENSPAKCITVENEEGLYVIENFIVTHNTKQIVDTTRILKEQGIIKRCLIICCINGNKYNWRDEIGIHSDEKGWILGTRRNKKGREFIGSNEDKLYDLDHLPEDYFYIITNLETLRYKKGIKTTLRSGRTKTVYEYPIVDKLVEMINSGELTYLAIDEVHKAANPTSQQGKALMALKDAGESVIVPMTGTPIRNKPLDVYLPLYLVGKEDHSFYSFQNHYCTLGGMGGRQVLGYKNMGELQEILDECMLRRRKNEVLDLPEKIYVTEYVEMSKKQTQLYEEVLQNIRSNVDLIRLSPDPLAQLLRLRQVTGNPAIISSIITDSPKYDRMEEMIAEHVEEGGKAIVFSNWTSIINPAYERLRIGGFNPALYTGENTKVRDEEKNRFQNDENCKVICGTIGAMGTGLTLTAADLVIFLDEPWTRANKDQAEDRAHRIGTTKSVRIVTLVCPGTIDEKINSLVYRKGKTSDILVDKEADLKVTPNVLNFLIN